MLWLLKPGSVGSCPLTNSLGWSLCQLWILQVELVQVKVSKVDTVSWDKPTQLPRHRPRNTVLWKLRAELTVPLHAVRRFGGVNGWQSPLWTLTKHLKALSLRHGAWASSWWWCQLSWESCWSIIVREQQLLGRTTRLEPRPVASSSPSSSLGCPASFLILKVPVT